MDCSTAVVNHTKTNADEFAANTLDPNPQTRSEGNRTYSKTAGHATIRESLSRLRKDHQRCAESLCQLFYYFRDRTPGKCRTRWACTGAQSHKSCERGNISAWACQCTSMLGCVKPTRLAHQRTVFTKDPTVARRCFNRCYSITDRS